MEDTKILQKFYWEKMTVKKESDLEDDYLYKNYSDCEKWIESLNDAKKRKAIFIYNTLYNFSDYVLPKHAEKKLFRLPNNLILSWWENEQVRFMKEKAKMDKLDKIIYG